AARGDRPAVADRAAADGRDDPAGRGPHGDDGVRRDAVPAGAQRLTVARTRPRWRPGRAAGAAASPVPPFLRFGSWVGGDRDGNPTVTAAITREAAVIQAEHALRGLGAARRPICR